MFKLCGLVAAFVLCAASAPVLASTDAGLASDAETFGARPQFAFGKPRSYTAVVNFNGFLWRGTAGTKSFLDSPATYAVEFYNAGVPVDVRFCAYNATLGGTSVLIPTPGLVAAAQRSGVNHSVMVRTWDTAGNLDARAFHLTVTCP